MNETKRARYTLEFKMEAVRLVRGGQVAAVTAKVLGIPKQTLENWVRLDSKGKLKGAGDKPVSAEQMELARLRKPMTLFKKVKVSGELGQLQLQCAVRLNLQPEKENRLAHGRG